MQLDIVSDTVCPWCYVGKRKLDRAFAERGHDGIDHRWRPYQLDPSIPPEGYDRREYMAKKFGPEKGKSIGSALLEIGDELGIPFNFDKIERSPNTLASHRLIRWADGADCQDEMVEILFRRYFVDGEDIGRTDVLVDAAGEAGMDTSLVRDLFDKGADIDLVQREEQLARNLGVQGVPTFVINNQYALVGAQEAPQLIKMFDKLVAKEREAAAAE